MVLLGLIKDLSGVPRYLIIVQEVAGYIMVVVFCLLLLKVYRGLLGGLVVLLGLVNGLSGLPR